MAHRTQHRAGIAQMTTSLNIQRLLAEQWRPQLWCDIFRQFQTGLQAGSYFGPSTKAQIS